VRFEFFFSFALFLFSRRLTCDFYFRRRFCERFHASDDQTNRSRDSSAACSMR